MGAKHGRKKQRMRPEERREGAWRFVANVVSKQPIQRTSDATAASGCVREELRMSDWKVLYRDDLDQDRTSRSSPSKKAALERARQLYLREHAEIYRIEGPNGLILPKEQIMRWVCASKG